MGSHGKKADIDLSKNYEKNEIGLKGIIGTAIALFVVCAISFYLMKVLQNQMEAYWVESEKRSAGPMDLTEQERLPPEPRLQGAPGFGVDSPKGRINLELKHPQAEWEELQKLWAAEEKDGQKAVVNGQETTVTLPIDEAKKQLVAQAKPGGVDAKAIKAETDIYYTTATAGRKPTGVKK